MIISSKVTAGKLCSTFRAHKLLFKAWKVGGQKTQQAMLNGIFKAYFTDVADISDKGVLADIAEKAGVLGRKEASCWFLSPLCVLFKPVFFFRL